MRIEVLATGLRWAVYRYAFDCIRGAAVGAARVRAGHVPGVSRRRRHVLATAS